MFVFTFKAKKIGIGLGCFAIALLVTMGAFRYIGGSGDAATIAASAEVEYSLDGKTAEKRLAFLNSVGVQVDTEPLEVVEVRIPGEFDEVYTSYNEKQKSCGFDLEKYAGKTVRKYRYAKVVGEGEAAEYVHLLIYKDTIIGGDITPAEAGGESSPLFTR